MAGERRYHVTTFGCRVNQADSAGFVEGLEELRGLERADSHLDADVVVLNTCTVTHRSDADVRKAVNRIRRENPNARVIVTGCYAERDPEALVRLGGVSAVVGNAHKHDVPTIAGRVLAAESSNLETLVVHTAVDGIPREDLPPVNPHSTVIDRTRPFVKIQDGCDAVCTYCIIPKVRGAGRSAEPNDVVRVVRELADRGFLEIVIAGVHLGRYGERLSPPESLATLVRRLLDIDGLVRLRLSGVEPMAFSMELAEIAATDQRLAPHFHLPLQSGADSVLKRMNRPYRATDYVEILEQVRTLVPRACLGTDVIVGFPGETDAELEATIDVVERSGINYLHVFSYSEREGAPSTRLGKKVDPRVVKERSARLHAVGGRLWHAFLDAQIGATVDAITLERETGGEEAVIALSDNYCPIRLPDSSQGSNRPVRVRVRERRGDVLVGDC